MTIDDRDVPGNLIALDIPRNEHEVEVWLGK